MEILEYIRSKFQPISHIFHSSSTATHLLLLQILLLLHVFQLSTILIFKLILIILASRFTFIKLLVSISIVPAKSEGGHGKGKKTDKPKTVLPSLSSDDDHDEHDDATPDVPITSTHTTPPESPVEPICKKSKKMRQLTAEEDDDVAGWL